MTITTTFGTATGENTAAVPATGSVFVELRPTFAPFDSAVVDDFLLLFDDVRLVLVLSSASPFLNGLSVEVNVRNLTLTSTEPGVAVVQPNGDMTIPAATFHVSGKVSVSAGLLGSIIRDIDAPLDSDLPANLSEAQGDAELVLTEVLTDVDQVEPDDLPLGITAATLVLQLDAREVVFAGSLARDGGPADADKDGDVDLADFLSFVACLGDASLGEPVPAGCENFDFDHDGDIDLADLVTFQARYTGSR